jgi:septal ring factor EnvC (AmiA/AmiB activator)
VEIEMTLKADLDKKDDEINILTSQLKEYEAEITSLKKRLADVNNKLIEFETANAFNVTFPVSSDNEEGGKFDFNRAHTTFLT